MCFHFWKQSRKIVFDIYFSNITIQTPSQTRLRAMRQNQTINPFPQSRQIGKGGGILNTSYEIGFGIKLQSQDISRQKRLLAVAPILFCHQDVGTVAVN